MWRCGCRCGSALVCCDLLLWSEDVSDEEAEPHDTLSAYELERRERIERHDAELRRLDLPELGNRY